jgi:hypothetical protein
MAEERYRVKFEVSGTEEVNQAIANQAKVVADLENTYARLRRQITELRNLRKTIGDVGGISPLAQKMEDLQKQSKGVGISLTAARRNLSELAEGANQAGASFEKMGNSAEAAGRKARKAASGTDNGFSGAVPMGPFRSKKEYDAAVAGLENVNKKTKEVTESTKKLGGASLLATSVFTKAGIPGAEALSVLINQFAVEGLKLKDLLDNFTFKIAAGVGVAAVTFQAMKAVFGSIRADAETILRLTESTAKAGSPRTRPTSRHSSRRSATSRSSSTAPRATPSPVRRRYSAPRSAAASRPRSCRSSTGTLSGSTGSAGTYSSSSSSTPPATRT